MMDTLSDLTAIARVREGLSALPDEPGITEAAITHAGDMAKGNYYSHLSPDGLDKTARISAAGYGEDCYTSEVMAKAYPDAFAVFAAFYGNSSYRTILSANFDAVGAGFAYNADSEGQLYCVQVFYAKND
jgi:uncharacterized protein YkwD